jgi:hypothetical protein
LDIHADIKPRMPPSNALDPEGCEVASVATDAEALDGFSSSTLIAALAASTSIPEERGEAEETVARPLADALARFCDNGLIWPRGLSG